jgi:hypothetical protein
MGDAIQTLLEQLLEAVGRAVHTELLYGTGASQLGIDAYWLANDVGVTDSVFDIVGDLKSFANTGP